MGTWTHMKVENLVKIEWADALKKFVRCQTVYGEMVESVEGLRAKLQSDTLLKPIRAVFQDMLTFADGNKDEKETVSGSPRVE